MKTSDTLALEEALDNRSRQRREYGCREVTIGFAKEGMGNEIVDYMSMDADGVFRCYEIKVTLSDLKSPARKSWYGDLNYLVISDELDACDPVFDNYIPPYVGIISGRELALKRKAKKKSVSEEQRMMLKDSLLRSVFWKMDGYRRACDPETLKAAEKELESLKKEYGAFQRKIERINWTYADYEFWYRRNHQDDAFSIEKGAQKERREATLREKGKFTWIGGSEGEFICPVCGLRCSSEEKSGFCPACGSDLRVITK